MEIKLDKSRGKDIYLKISKRRALINEVITIDVARSEKINISDIVTCEGITGIVENIEQQRPSKIKGLTFQRSKIKVNLNSRLYK